MNGVVNPTLSDLAKYFLKLGATTFGGPVVLAEAMRRDLVEDKKWVTAQEFSEGFALAQLAPGPLASQVAIYLGWLRFGIRGASVAAIAFVLPSLTLVLFLAFLYKKFGGLDWLQGAFYGVGAAVIAIIAISAYRLNTKTFQRDWLLWTVGSFSAITTFVTQSENLWIFFGAGVLVACIRTPPKFLGRLSSFAVPPILMMGLHGEATATTLWTILAFFFKSGALVFGSGLAIVPFLHSGVVLEHQWLTDRQFLDAVAIGMITPGPLIITVAFIGSLVAGVMGGVVAAFGAFFPCYLFVVLPAPYFKRISKNKTIFAIIEGITAAAIGAIAGAALILAEKSIVDTTTFCIALISILILSFTRKVPDPILILVAGTVGVLAK